MMEVFWIVLMCACAVGAFNVDVNSCVRHHAPRRGSMFGFAVQEHVENGVNMVLVGAPKDDNRRRPGVYRPGAVYQCNAMVENDCREVIFDSKGNNNDSSFRPIEQKSEQWFGATLASTGVNGPIVACAPRYVSYISSKLNQREPVGTCYVAKNSFTDIEEYAPCRTTNYGYHRTGVAQAGFGAAVSKDGSRLFMGAPGSYYWQGQAISMNTSLSGNPYFWPRKIEGQTYAQSLFSRPMVVATAESSSNNDDSYLGYSMTVGAFDKSGEQGVAVGMPRGAELRGKVVMYTSNLTVIKNVSGSQIGAYFGYSVACGDLDGDGEDDLIVGAPMYTVPNNDGSFEQGRVYVIYQRSGLERSFMVNHYRTGEVSRGRFGLSLTSLGDINFDSYGDFAVGAPYGGPNGRGVVYLFYGSANGVREKYSQAITAEDVEPGMSTFGFSLSGGIDMDGNQYNDLVVGAYKSDAAVFFRARPVVRVTSSVELELGGSKEVSLEDTKCTLKSGLKVACMDVHYCLRYDGINVDTVIEFEVGIVLDSQRKKNRRMFFLHDETHSTLNDTVTLNKLQQWCNVTTVYIGEVRDKLTPLQVTMEYNLRRQQYVGRDGITPVLDFTVGNSDSDAVVIKKNCGPDKVCTPDLNMNVEPTVSRYLLGSQEKLSLNVFIENNGEDAFEAMYYLQIPRGVDFVKTERRETGTTEGTSVHCATSAPAPDGATTLKCDIGNPLRAQQMVKFKVVLWPHDLDNSTQKYAFSMETNSTNPEPEATASNNRHTLDIAVWVDTNVSIVGMSSPPELHYNASLYQTEEGKSITRDTEFGPHVVHAYNVKNNGPSSIEEAEIYLLWPYQTRAGEDLFYLLSQPETSGNITCARTEHVNENLYTIDNKNRKLHLPQIIRSLEANKISVTNVSETLTSEEIRKKIEIEQQRLAADQRNQFSQSHGSQSGYTHSQNANSAQSQGNYYNQQGSAYTGGSNQARSSEHGGTTQYGSNSNQFGFSSVQHGSTVAQSGGAWQQGSSSNKYGDFGRAESSGSYGASSGYGASGQYGGVTQGGAAGSGHRYNVYKERNTTIDIDEHGHVRKTETSTEYGGLGHEGEAGSSWNNRQGNGYRSSSTYNNNQGAYNQNWSQTGSTGSNLNYGHAYYGQNIGLSTEESVNKNLFNAGSRTSIQSYQGSDNVEEVVGGEEEAIGGLASVAGNPNNEFRTVWSNVDGAGSSRSGQASSEGHSGTRYLENSYGNGGAYSSGSSGGYSSGGGQYVSGGGAYASRSGASSSGAAAYGGASQGGSESSYSASSRGGSAARSGSSYYESNQYSSSSSGGFSSESSSSHGRPANYQQWGHRSKRNPNYTDIDQDVAAVLTNCSTNFKCAIIRCVTGVLQKDQEVWVSLQGRINAKFLNEMSKEREVLLTTVAAARVSRLPRVGKPLDAALATFQAGTHVTPRLEAPSAGSVPLWVVVLAAIAGTLLLLLLIFALYKCGFFKRNRPTDHAERQPLNRNGYGHGDEHL